MFGEEKADINKKFQPYPTEHPPPPHPHPPPPPPPPHPDKHGNFTKSLENV